MRILLAAAECSPLARTGGLGEAVAGLGAGLRRMGVEATAVIPGYRHLAGLGEPAGRAPGPAAGLRRVDAGELPVLLVDDPESFDRPGIYGSEPGSGYDDQWRRFGRFSTAVREMAAGYDLLHLHDGHCGPAALSAPVPTVFTIHNAAYSILGPLRETARLVGATAEERAPGGALEWFGRANFLKAGAAGAGAVTAVSPAFARDLMTDPEASGGLDGVLAARGSPVTGILNGIDSDSWDPARDPALPAFFSKGRLTGRAEARRALLERAGLEEGEMVLGAVTRMTGQKGIDLLHPVMDDLTAEGLRFAFVGGGDLEGMVDGWAERHPGAVRRLPYEENLARLACAGSDAFLMPSRFEPCGLGQMYAMRYGAPPIARLTGGLADTVFDLDEHPERATGFGFRSPQPESLAKTIRRARRVFQRHRSEWRRLQRNGMSADFSWTAPAAQYAALYQDLIA